VGLIGVFFFELVECCWTFLMVFICFLDFFIC